MGPAANPIRKVRVDRIDVYARQLSEVDAAAPGSAAAKATIRASAAAARLSIAYLLPGHCLHQPPMAASAEAALREILHTTSAVRSSLSAHGEAGTALGTTSDVCLRILAPRGAIAAEWLPATCTTQAAWQLLMPQCDTGGLADGSCSQSRLVVPGGGGAVEEGGGCASRVGIGAGAGPAEGLAAAALEGAYCVYDARSLQQALEALEGCRSGHPNAIDGPGQARPGLDTRQYFTALAQVRPALPHMRNHNQCNARASCTYHTARLVRCTTIECYSSLQYENYECNALTFQLLA